MCLDGQVTHFLDGEHILVSCVLNLPILILSINVIICLEYMTSSSYTITYYRRKNLILLRLNL